MGSTEEQNQHAQPTVHPFILAHSWQQELNTDPGLTMAKIATREGTSRSRVTQIMNLLRLPRTIREILLNPPASLTIGDFSERRLRELLRQSDLTTQMEFWRKWLEELCSARV